ncbi:hypothetical protein CDEST_14798 [Colletotrichum destructivum]|uniref:Uncharacterized protein n=1 Tax=Colletotrichum destructivum TaxID=34406 RepID=A0AAX4J2J4_9PEZI|nr:hypothetical protein CDEST_14798 [Colletotrichum destructivum]
MGCITNYLCHLRRHVHVVEWRTRRTTTKMFQPLGQGCKGQMATNTSRDGRESSSSSNNITSIISIIGITSHNARDTDTPKTPRPQDPKTLNRWSTTACRNGRLCPPPPGLHADPPITETSRPYRRVSLHPL